MFDFRDYYYYLLLKKETKGQSFFYVVEGKRGTRSSYCWYICMQRVLFGTIQYVPTLVVDVLPLSPPSYPPPLTIITTYDTQTQTQQNMTPHINHADINAPLRGDTVDEKKKQGGNFRRRRKAAATTNCWKKEQDTTNMGRGICSSLAIFATIEPTPPVSSICCIWSHLHGKDCQHSSSTSYSSCGRCH